MLCQKCNKKIATVFISTTLNGENSQMYLCTDCAKEFNSSINVGPDINIPFPIKDILSNMDFDESAIDDLMNSLKDMEGNSSLEEKEKKVREEEIKCSICNTSFDEYKKTGKLGCSKCYEAFEKQLMPILEGVYGYSEHVGKFPNNEEFEDVQKIRQVEMLKQELNIAVEEEEYEKAAELRDKIIELESQGI